MTARSIMVQGTMSGAGKSLLVAGLARVFAQDGYKVAPFKSQNMALNSAITADGFEMGRAQVVQAEAAGIEPEVAMNPILLKPTTDTGSQVIVNGKPLGTMAARDYFAFKHELVPDIMQAYNDLSSRFDIIVLEGAGSPAEINLKDDDIVNMGMAKMAGAPVLLAGDIDRGGVFAQLMGTLMLLDDDEHALVKGTIVNKFRGDKTILDPGLEVLRERTGIPVAGVIPFASVDIDDEDSMSDRFSAHTDDVLVDIAVMRLPKISNFTDFIALEALEGVGVRYVGRVDDLRNPDLIIVPGTKSTMADLRWLRETGLETAIQQRAAAGIPILGICGGYQMLGLDISDPHGMEGGGNIAGMGLLPTHTVFDVGKHTVQSKGEFLHLEGPLSALSGAQIEGYEIHMGTTTRVAGNPATRLEYGDATVRDDGCNVGNVYGTYLHGVFDKASCNAALVGALLKAKGLDVHAIESIDMKAYKQRQYDIWADVIREHMDMDLVYRILEEGV
jgi:adenosylcobyric acid synthase